MGDSRVTNTQRDFLVFGVVACVQKWRQWKGHLAWPQSQHDDLPNSSFRDVPSGPTTSTADTGTSFFLLRTLDLGRSKKRNDTSGGTDMAAPPIRELLAGVEEKVRAWCDFERHGRRKRGMELDAEASLATRRSDLLAAGQDIVGLPRLLVSRLANSASSCCCQSSLPFVVRPEILGYQTRLHHFSSFPPNSHDSWH
jgi:hypothetical protein